MEDWTIDEKALFLSVVSSVAAALATDEEKSQQVDKTVLGRTAYRVAYGAVMASRELKPKNLPEEPA